MTMIRFFLSCVFLALIIVVGEMVVTLHAQQELNSMLVDTVKNITDRLLDQNQEDPFPVTKEIEL